MSVWTVGKEMKCIYESLEHHKANQRAVSPSAGCCIHFAFILNAYFPDSHTMFWEKLQNILEKMGHLRGVSGYSSPRLPLEPIWKH